MDYKMISIVIPTRGYWPKPDRLIHSILEDISITWIIKEIICIIEFDKSTLWRKDLIKKCKEKNLDLIVANQDGYGVSASRNHWTKIASQDTIIFMDDDITIPNGFVWDILDEYNGISREINKDIMLYPTVLRWDTDQIRSKWFVYFNRLLWRPVAYDATNNWKDKIRDKIGLKKIFGPTYWDIKLSNIICMVVSKKITNQVNFDEDMRFVYEDLDRTYRVYRSGYPIFISWKNFVRHYESQKTKLELAYINNAQNIYNKVKHRIQFVLKNANKIQLIWYYIFWFWASNLWTMMMICAYSDKKKIHIWALLRGIRDWLKTK